MQFDRNLVAAYDFTKPNQSTILAQDRVTIKVDDKSYIGKGQAALDLIPKSRIHIYSKLQNISPDIILHCATGQKKISSFQFGDSEIDGILVGIGGSAHKNTAYLKWRVKDDVITYKGNNSAKISRVVFHLFNFQRVSETVEILGSGWKGIIQPFGDPSYTYERLKYEGGYALTHVGGFRKIDGSYFLAKEAREFLKILDLFFSFLKGIRCNPICAVGYNNSEDCVWKSWSSPRESWETPISWFDPYQTDQLKLLFPGFVSRVKNEKWQAPLREVICWYLSANHPQRGIDTGIILAQAALERFSYRYAVENLRLLSSEGFKKLKASDSLRVLLSSMGIPLCIPQKLSELINLSKEFNWNDGPDALTEIRNSIVHPGHKRKDKFNKAYMDAWNLGLWYIEMVVLRMCGYVGTYRNRLDLPLLTGKVEKVPWQNRLNGFWDGIEGN